MSSAPDNAFHDRRSRAKLRATAFDLGLGERIRSARLAAAMTQSSLGKAIGVTYQQIHKYEYGEDRVSAAAIQRIADVLDLHPGVFFEGSPRPERTPTGQEASR